MSKPGVDKMGIKNRIKRIRLAGERGFTLFEVVVGMALIGVAVLGLAQLFALCVAQNMRADRMSTATFLAQQQIDSLRDLTGGELGALQANSPIDEQLDVNVDNTIDYRRITTITPDPVFTSAWDVRVMVFSAEQLSVGNVNDLITNPAGHKIKAYITTMISR
jgi:prepilin-type N-terminal cleavage/methylation domain-containing protein